MMNRIIRWTLLCGAVAAILPSLGCSQSVTMPAGSITATENMQMQVATIFGQTRPSEWDPRNRQRPNPPGGGK